MTAKLTSGLAALLLFGLALVALTPSGASLARWSDSTTLVQADLSADLAPDSRGVTVEPVDLPPAPGSQHSTPGFSFNNGSAVSPALVSLSNLRLDQSSGGLSAQSYIQLALAYDNGHGPRTCEVLTGELRGGTADPGSYTFLTEPIRGNAVHTGNGYSFRPSLSLEVPAGQTAYVCPLIQYKDDPQPGRAGGFPMPKFDGTSTDIILTYSHSFEAQDGSGTSTARFSLANPLVVGMRSAVEPEPTEAVPAPDSQSPASTPPSHEDDPAAGQPSETGAAVDPAPEESTAAGRGAS